MLGFKTLVGDLKLFGKNISQNISLLNETGTILAKINYISNKGTYL